jgi:ABC-type nitrate/sulfonate/bicarbonate transport system substrate-binding protein
MSMPKLLLRRWRVAVALTAAALLALPPAPARAAAEKTTLALPALALIFLSDYVAEAAHLYEKEGLDVKVVLVTGVGAFNAVVSGSADFSMSSGLTLNRAAAHGQRMLAIANTIDHFPGELVLRKDIADAIHFDPEAPLATRAKAMIGRTMGVDSINSIVHAYLRVIAHAGGIDPEKITVAPLQPADMLGALDRKAVDGFSFGPPWPEKVLTEGKAVLLASGLKGDPPGLTPFAYNVLVTRPDYCAAHASICTKMGHAMIDAARFIHDHPDETLGFLRARYKDVSGPALKLSLDEITAATPLLPKVDATGLANADRLNIEAGLMKPEDKVKSYDGLFTEAYLK